MKLQKETIAHGKWYRDACAAAFAMELLGERWTILVIRELTLGARRFSDIRASLPGISARVLTERLERLEALGVLVRRKLPPPAASNVYELTEWGYEFEPVMQALGRWAVRSPLHDPTLPMTSASFMLSLRTMIDPARASALELTARFECGDAKFLATLSGGELAVRRADDGAPAAELVFRADDASRFLPVFYGKRPPAAAGVEVIGNEERAKAFVDLFRLPPKCALPTRAA